MSYAMESAALSKYVPAAGGIFLPAADTAITAAESAADTVITAAVSAADTAIAAAAISTARAVPAAILSESGIRSYAAAVCSPSSSGSHARGQPGFVNPYPVPRPNQQQSSQFSGILSQFKKTNGQFDFNKMMDTTGQMVSAVNQVGSLVKGLTSIFK